VPSVLPTFITRSKVLKALFCISKTFDLVFKVVSADFGTRSKVLKAKNSIIKTFNQNQYLQSFDLVPVGTRSNDF
jgi:hypothetical protein